MVPLTISGCHDGIRLGANAQRRRNGDKHELNALRTYADRLSAPGTPNSKRNAHYQTRLFRDAALERRPVPTVPYAPQKSSVRRWRSALFVT